MTTYDAQIVDENDANPVYGDHVEVIRNVSGLDSGQYITKGWLTVKQRYSETDAEAALQLEITQVNSADGQITDPGSGDVDASLLFRIWGDHYTNLIALKYYVYDIQLLLNDGTINTLEVGGVVWEKEVTEART